MKAKMSAKKKIGRRDITQSNYRGSQLRMDEWSGKASREIIFELGPK